VSEDDQSTSSEREQVRHELGRLQKFAQGLRLDEVRHGTWFSKLVRNFLDQYVRDVDAAYFQREYPGLPADAVVQARIDRAARYAGIEGGLSAGAYTGLVAATLGSGGAASPLTLPGAGASFVLDLLYVSQLQLKLAYDIAVLYRFPLDLEDPEDLWKLIRIAFVIKGGEAGRGLVGKGAPALVRPVLTRIYGWGTLGAARSLPAVGKYLLQRNIMKFTIPAVGVPLSMAVNRWSTRSAGAYAVRVFRREAAVVEAARRMAEVTRHPAELVWVLWMVIKADGLVHEHERLLLKQVTGRLGDPESELAALSELERTVDLQRNRVWPLLEAAVGDLRPLYDAAVEAAAVDGKINVNELAVLRRLAGHCGVGFDEGSVRAKAAAYAKSSELG
jgi:tellurite resistance protein